MNEKICYYKGTAFDRLESYLTDYLGWYLGQPGEDAPPDAFLSESISELNTKTSTAELKLVVVEDNMPGTDKVNALAVYEHLQDLTPQQASFERLWALYCHKHRDYVIARWLNTVEIPDGQDKKAEAAASAEKTIRQRFFLTGVRGVVNGNALSRLWQMGNLAHAVEPDNPAAFLDVMLQSQDVWKQSVERATVFSSKETMEAAYRVMSTPSMSLLAHRSNFRRWMEALDKKASSIMFGSLDKDELLAVFKKEAEAVMKEADK